MALHSPFYREMNFHRISKLRVHHSDATVARIVSEQIGEKVYAADIRSYAKLNKTGSSRMLVSSTVFNELMDVPQKIERDYPDAGTIRGGVRE